MEPIKEESESPNSTSPLSKISEISVGEKTNIADDNGDSSAQES